ncbi:E2/UBC family protein [Mesorhizobium sp. J8]|uniref:E2/UBC family protein n=1 Tax=Mesorhizobium sp. J8 TaxID=2777475 RepID=UPI001916AF0F|nr:E2/UBC family protein [Mesorhizobium sp. J8]BCM17512.1 hypothetical protein MJ8_12780 [Mesorhizobium sp. J8]
MFLPEDDQIYLAQKSLRYTLREEAAGQDIRRGIEFPEFEVPANLARKVNGQPVPGGQVRLLVLIPPGYAKVRLDSWYVSPGLFHLDGREVDRANGQQVLFGENWQFWSRHLTDGEWRADIDGLATYLQYIHSGLRAA